MATILSCVSHTWTRAADEPANPNPKPSISIAELQRSTAVDFEKEILPILKNNCLACHNQTKAKADLVLETPQTILKGGESGPGVIAGKSAESLLLKLASHQDKPAMPPKDNKVNALDLTPEQLGLVKLWIDQGARGEVHGQAPIVWQPLAENLNPIFAVVLSPDGQYAACGRGNQLFVYHVPTRRLAARLVDPKLEKTGVYTNCSAAHLDLVHALAFNGSGDLLASGGYREVKLWRRVRNVPKFTLPQVHSGAVRALAASRDGKWFATGNNDGVVKIWNANTADCSKTLSGHEKAVTSLKFSPDGIRLLSGSLDKTIRVWDLTSGKLFAQAQANEEVSAVTWLSKGQQIASGGGTNTMIQLWQVPETDEELKPIQQLSGHESAITALDVLAGSDEELVSGSNDGSVRVWNLEKGETIRQFDHGSPVASVAVRPDGKRIASAGQSKVAKLWNAEDGKLIAELKGDGEAQQRVWGAEKAQSYATSQVNYRKSAIEKAEKDRTAQVERVKKATEASLAAEKALPEKQKALADAKPNQSAAEKALADIGAELKKATDEFEAADAAGSKAIADAKAAIEKAMLAHFEQKAAQIKSEVEKVLADALVNATSKTNSGADAVAATDKSNQNISSTEKPSHDSPASSETAKNPGASDVASLIQKSLDEVVAKAQAAGQARAVFDRFKSETEKKQKEADEKLKAAKKAVTDAESALKKAELARSTSENELHLAINAAQKAADALTEAQSALQLAETEQKQRETSVALMTKAAAEMETTIRTVAFSSDNLLLATGGDDQRIHTWTAQDGKTLGVLSGHQAAVSAVVFAGEHRVISGAPDEPALVWNLNAEWQLERVIGTGDEQSPIIDRVNALRFTPDGKQLITGGGEPSRSGELKIWKVSDGTLVQELKNVHSDVVLGLDLTPDGKYLASSAADKFIRIIDLSTGKIMRSLEGHTHHVLGVSWKRDGRTLISGGADNVAKVWDAFAGERKKNIEGFNKEITSINFIGDTDQALVCSGDNSVRLVKENGDKVRSFEGGADFMEAAAVTFDGQIVIAGGQDGVLRAWDGITGDLITSFAEKN